MNKYIKEQLKKVRRAKIPTFDDTTTTLVIEKLNSAELTIQVGHYYIVELQNYIINPPPNFTLAANWNNGISPKSKYLNCYVKKIMGKMLCIDGVGFDLERSTDLTDHYANLWLPEAGVKIMEEL